MKKYDTSSRSHIEPVKRRDEEEMRKRKKIGRGNIEPVEKPVKGQTDKGIFKF